MYKTGLQKSRTKKYKIDLFAKEQIRKYIGNAFSLEIKLKFRKKITQKKTGLQRKK